MKKWILIMIFISVNLFSEEKIDTSPILFDICIVRYTPYFQSREYYFLKDNSIITRDTEKQKTTLLYQDEFNLSEIYELLKYKGEKTTLKYEPLIKTSSNVYYLFKEYEDIDKHEIVTSFPETYYLNLGENDFKIKNNFQILTSGNKDNIEFLKTIGELIDEVEKYVNDLN